MDAKGSLRHIRWYVNEAPGQVDAAIRAASASLASSARDHLEWVSPLAREEYREYWNAGFLNRLGLSGRLADFRSFWPFSGAGTPHWDALAKVPLTTGHGALMIEAKARRGEFSRLNDATGAKGPAFEKIRGSLAKARTFYGADPSAPAWESSHYQLCNRLAHLYWMNEVAEVPTWLAWVFICDDPVWTDRLSAPQWADEFSAALESVGLPENHPLSDRVVAVYLPAAPAFETG